MDKRASVQEVTTRQWKNAYQPTNRYSTLPKKQLPQSSAANGGLIDVKKWSTIEYAQKLLPVTEEQANASIVGKLLTKRKLEQEALKQTITVDVSKLNLNKNDMRRQEVIYELVLTERDYVNDVKVLCELFISKIKDKKLLSQMNVRKIFSNVEELYGVNQVFYQALFEKRAGAFEQAFAAQNDSTLTEEERHMKAAGIISKYTMGDVFNLITPYFRSYALYCSNHNDACETLNSILKLAKQNKELTKAIKRKHMSITPKQAQALKVCLSAGNEDVELDVDKQREKAKEFALYMQYCSFRPECRNLDIFAFLIKPIQRICKYPLLLKELIKLTPEDHPDYALLSKALTLVEKVVSEVNERGRFHDGQQMRIIELRKTFMYEDASFVGIEQKGFDLLGLASRKLLKEQGLKGDLYEVRDIEWYVPGKKLSESQFVQRQVFLFNDCIICTKQQEKSIFGQKGSNLRVKCVVSLLNVTLVDKIEDSESSDFQLTSGKISVYALRVYVKDFRGSKDGVLCFGLPTAVLRDQWYDMISEVVQEVKQNKVQRANFVFKPSRLSTSSRKHASVPVGVLEQSAIPTTENQDPVIKQLTQIDTPVVQQPQNIPIIEEVKLVSSHALTKLPEVKDGIDLSETVRPYLDQIDNDSTASLDIFGDDIESSKLYRSLTGSKPPKKQPEGTIAAVPPTVKEVSKEHREDSIEVLSLDRKDSGNSGEKFVNPLALARSSQIFVSNHSIKVSKLEPVLATSYDSQKTASLGSINADLQLQSAQYEIEDQPKTDSFVITKMSKKFIALRHSSFMRHKTSLSSTVLDDVLTQQDNEGSSDSIVPVQQDEQSQEHTVETGVKFSSEQQAAEVGVNEQSTSNSEEQAIETGANEQQTSNSEEQAIETGVSEQQTLNLQDAERIVQDSAGSEVQVVQVQNDATVTTVQQQIPEQVVTPQNLNYQAIDKIVEVLLNEAGEEERKSRPTSPNDHVKERQDALTLLQQNVKSTLSEVFNLGSNAPIRRVDSQTVIKTVSKSSSFEVEQETIIEMKEKAKNQEKRVTLLKDKFEQLSQTSLDNLAEVTKPVITLPKPRINTVQQKLKMFEASAQKNSSQYVQRTQSTRFNVAK